MSFVFAVRKVVAGLNYKLMLGIFRNNVCLGGFKVAVYKPLPHMQRGLAVTSWGDTFESYEISDDCMHAATTETEKEKPSAVVEGGGTMEKRKEVIEPES